MRAHGVLVGCLVFGGACAGEVISNAPESMELTIYRDWHSASSENIIAGDSMKDSLGMVRETRMVELPAGRSRLMFRGVAALIVPHSARLAGLPGQVLERNFDYDLLSPGALIAKSIGQPVRVLRAAPTTGRSIELTGILRSGPQGMVIESAGRFEPLDCTGHGDKLILERVPDGLVDVPTLSLEVAVGRAGRYTLELSYLTLGVAWSADYVAHLQPDGETLDLIGWLTLGNISNTTFQQVPIRAVAGKLARDPDTVPPGAPLLERGQDCWQAHSYFLEPSPPAQSPAEVVLVTGSYIPDAESLGDYKLYTLAETTTLAARQSKQVQFLERRSVKVRRVYQFEVDSEYPQQAPLRVLRLLNKRAANLGLPLPHGKVFVLEAAGPGAGVYGGESSLGDVPVGLSNDLLLGEALDVSVTTTLLQDEQYAAGPRKGHRQRLRVAITNAKSVPIEVELMQPRYGTDFRISRGSRGFRRQYDYLLRQLRLAAGEHRVVEYTIEWLDRR